jgi:lipopolysaccharide transport system ATP-binding protein
MSSAVRFEGVSKRYRGVGPYRTLRDDLVGGLGRLVTRRGGNPPFIAALEDVSFEVPVGASVAIMGPNGSGKSTALKIISRITWPTTGAVRVRGRVGALIEVGTGLHPELSGRENIQLYGRILGLTGSDIRTRYRRIVDFAGLGPAIDQPVKQYSTGMQLRLGFSLASHLEPDVLLVDEAVSVGDAAFQHRCVSRMMQLVQSGVTLIFVSHLPSLVASLCTTGIVLDRGRIVEQGPVADAIATYLRAVWTDRDEASTNPGLRLRGWDWQFEPSSGRFLGDLVVRLRIDVAGAVHNPRFSVALADPRSPQNLVVCSMLADGFDTGHLARTVDVSCHIRDLPLEPGAYPLWLSVASEDGVQLLIEPRLLGHVALDTRAGPVQPFAGTTGHGVVSVPYAWSVDSPVAALTGPGSDGAEAPSEPSMAESG